MGVKEFMACFETLSWYFTREPRIYENVWQDSNYLRHDLNPKPSAQGIRVLSNQQRQFDNSQQLSL
jgi:hypothetical protein